MKMSSIKGYAPSLWFGRTVRYGAPVPPSKAASAASCLVLQWLREKYFATRLANGGCLRAWSKCGMLTFAGPWRWGNKAGALLWALAVAALFPATVWAAGPVDPEWPCIQRKQPRLSAGAMWAGPPVDQIGRGWVEDAEVAELVPDLAARRTPVEEAEARIADFAAGLGPDRNRSLALLFAGTFQRIDRERQEIISGIARYAEKQRALSESLDALRAEIAELAAIEDPSFDQQDRLEALEDELAWKTRIHREREQSLVYVCESPVLLEQRIFTIARAIMEHLE